ncbi:hypothetical protein AGMMS50262_12210 [Bacteroidia bacterium]|nr:hypothetical protein AGMMS50262_12210 [Bacteroidia bacterium]
MKKYVFITGIILTLHFCAQGQNKVALYNRGIMSVGDVLYIGGDYENDANASVSQTGNTILTGDFINNVDTGKVFSIRTGAFEFRGSTAQHIFGTADRDTNYIWFPETLTINNQNANPDSVVVVISPSMGATMKNLVLTRGRLTLDSDTNSTRQSNVAHLLVEGTIAYNRAPTNAYDQGIIQVNLALGDNYKEKRLTGFTPPFKKIYADYFFFNFLSQPTNAGLFGDNGTLIIDPQTPLNPGTGYIVGLGIVPDGDPYYANRLNPLYSAAQYSDKAKDTLSFARNFAPSSIMVATASDRFTDEELTIDDVTVILKQGFNYIGNPFTVPLDMSGFVSATNTADAWGVTRAPDGTADVRNSFYVMSQGTGSYNASTERFTFNVSYLFGQAVGGTISHAGGNSSLLIAPMQMFIVGRDAVASKSMTIPASARTHGKVSYLRSAPLVTDELLIEARDSRTGGYDRLCVVFREDATLQSNDPYDASKIFNRSGGVNQIYTQSSDGKSMTTNVISTDPQQLILYFEPANQEQEVVLEAYRQSSLSSIKKVILEDTKTGTKTDLLSTPDYSFLSRPTDSFDRFILHFDNQTGIETIGDRQAVTMYYNTGIITIQGLSETDKGSVVKIFDMYGRLLQENPVRQVPAEKIATHLPAGTYIVKFDAIAKKLLIQ